MKKIKTFYNEGAECVVPKVQFDEEPFVMLLSR